MKFTRRKGMTLIVVMMIMIILSILGASFLSLSAYQSNQAIRENKGLQAHYIARAGAEAALKAWQNAPSTAKPSGAFDKVYLSSSNVFSDTPATNSKGEFFVTITANGTSTVIKSVGTVGTIKKAVNVTVNTIVSVIPGPTPSYVDGDKTGFYTDVNGQINPGKWPSTNGKGTVKNEAKNGKGLKLVNKNAGTSTLTYEKMVFSSPIQVMHNSIILVANVIAFTQPVDFSLNGNSKGNLTLKVYGSQNGVTAITRADGFNWGIVSFNGKGYYYKDGVIIKSENDIAQYVSLGQMELITDPSVINGHLAGVIPTSLTVTSYSILWSK
jgi:type II secretory pathway pseudopilin PulG